MDASDSSDEEDESPLKSASTSAKGYMRKMAWKNFK